LSECHTEGDSWSAIGSKLKQAIEFARRATKVDIGMDSSSYTRVLLLVLGRGGRGSQVQARVRVENLLVGRKRVGLGIESSSRVESSKDSKKDDCTRRSVVALIRKLAWVTGTIHGVELPELASGITIKM
jgi:hypothetical protein